MKRIVTLSLQYYKTLLLYNIAFTVVVTAIAAFNSHGNKAPGLMFNKILGFAAAIGLYHFSSSNSYFYYRNAGYAMWRIITTAFFIDVIVCLIIMLTAYGTHACLA